MPKSTSNPAKSNGRPHSYDPDLVFKIVAEGLAAGLTADELDAPKVRKTLCDEYGAKPMIRLEAIESLVLAAHAEIQEAEQQALIAALPDSAIFAVNKAVAAAGEALLLLVARQHSAALVAADATCEELRVDKRTAQYRIAQLEGELADQKDTNCSITRERDELAQQVRALKDEVVAQQLQLERHQQDAHGIERLLVELRNPAVLADFRTALSQVRLPQVP